MYVKLELVITKLKKNMWLESETHPSSCSVHLLLRLVGLFGGDYESFGH